MKVIFLDMDGVLNGGYAIERPHYIEKKYFGELKRIVEETGANVVLSTSWREFPDWKLFLTDFFACVDIKVIGSTEILNNRPDEINRWLSENNDIDTYVVLDDWDMREQFPNNMVHTIRRGRCGLDKWFADKAIEILNKEIK